MEIAAKQSIRTSNTETVKSITLAEKFTEYCHSLESSRVLLLSFTLILQVCILVPATLLITQFYDMGLNGLTIGILGAGTVAVLVSNMAEMPIKAILISFILSTTSTLILLAVHLLS
jgi:hypothetical protein